MDGCNSRVEREYSVAKRWFDHHYKSVSGRLRPFLEVERSGEDVLLSLLGSPSLKDLLHRDGGDLLPRIGRISDAVYRCDASFEA